MTDGGNFTESIESYDMPTRKAILQYLVRMGSFTFGPKIPNEDIGDEDVEFPSFSSWNDIAERCSQHLIDWPDWPRQIFRVMERHARSHGKEKFRIMQWNILAQALADGSDHFVNCPPPALTWESRRWLILQEIAQVKPDILCMQEVDHFNFFNKALCGLGYFGAFCSKPESPCFFIEGNNGPDGCAIFINAHIFEILDTKRRTLEAYECETNQVVIACKVRRRSDMAEFWVATTHLKARSGSFMEDLRRQQGCDLVEFLKGIAGDNTPVLICGDFNAEPMEPVHDVLRSAGFVSAYDSELMYTTWTIREEGECKKVLDYILYKNHSFHVEKVLKIPCESEIGAERVPSFKYPSDHFSMAADVVLTGI